MSAYYNEIDPYAAQWLRNLIAAGQIAPGVVDERSIVDVRPDDLKDFAQCHFFAGIGGWPFALRLAGWGDSRPVWTGSCPCQPFSGVNKHGRGEHDPRNLWPDFYRLITERRPAIVFGEQVASGGGPEWLARVRADMEAAEFALGSANLPAGSVGSPQKRERLWFVAVGIAQGVGWGEGVQSIRSEESPRADCGRASWADAGTLGADGRRRRTGPNIRPVGHGIPARMGRLRGYGNAIVPQVAAQFITAADEAMISLQTLT